MPFLVSFTNGAPVLLPSLRRYRFRSPQACFFAAAGASSYRTGRFLTVVTICRGARYVFIAIIADHYGRHFIRVLRHPAQYWGWLLLFAAVMFGLIMAGIVLNKQLAATTSASA